MKKLNYEVLKNSGYKSLRQWKISYIDYNIKVIKIKK